MKEFLERAQALREFSNCAKAQLGVVIVKDGIIIGEGWNSCAPNGRRAEPIAVCPKATKSLNHSACHSISAEIAAALSIRPSLRSEAELKQCEKGTAPTAKLVKQLFSADELQKLAGATAYIAGDNNICDHCRTFLGLVGIYKIIFLDQD